MPQLPFSRGDFRTTSTTVGRNLSLAHWSRKSPWLRTGPRKFFGILVGRLLRLPVQDVHRMPGYCLNPTVGRMEATQKDICKKIGSNKSVDVLYVHLGLPKMGKRRVMFSCGSQGQRGNVGQMLTTRLEVCPPPSSGRRDLVVEIQVQG